MDQNFGYGAEKKPNLLEDESDSSDQYDQEEHLDQKQDRRVDPDGDKFEKTPHEQSANWGDEDSYSPSEDENTPSEEGPDEDP